MKQNWRSTTGTMLVLYFISGVAALIYEVTWSKYLTLMFGSTVQAQTIILSTFMLGLAIGNQGMGCWSSRIRNPLWVYALLEIAMGIYGFLFVPFYEWIDGCFTKFGVSLLDHSKGLFILKLGMSLILMLIPTILMGGTIPLLANWIKERKAVSGNGMARLYGVNGLGAVYGAWLAGFVLIQRGGLSLAIWTAAALNILIGFAAMGLHQKKLLGKGLGTESEVSPQGTSRVNSAWGWSELVVLLTGAVSMGLEVLCSRSLTLIFGGSSQSFSLVLMAFILGIGMAGMMVSTRWVRSFQPAEASVTCVLLAAVVLTFWVTGIESWAVIFGKISSGFAYNATGYHFHLFWVGCLSVILLSIPAFFLGLVLPIWMQHRMESEVLAGWSIGRLLAFNTWGSVGGSLITGLVLMPIMGLRNSFGVLILCLVIPSLFALLLARRWGLALVFLFVAMGMGIQFSSSGKDWRHVFSAGVFRYRNKESLGRDLDIRKKTVELLHYEDGSDATVSVEKPRDGEEISLRINGKADASSNGDLSTQFLLAHLPLFAKPESKEVFVLGLGSGITAGAVLGHPIDHLTLCENSKAVLKASRFFEPWNRKVLEDSRTKVYNEDARTVLKLSPRIYDVIISEPSNPWMIGVGSVFSIEFYQLAASKMKEDGVMAQWFHIYEMNDDIVAMVLRTFQQVFPHMEIWDTQGGDIVMLGSRKRWDSNPMAFAKGFEREQPRADLLRIGLRSPIHLWARQLASQATAPRIAGSGKIQTDEIPHLEYEAPKAFYVGKMATLLQRCDERTWLISQMDSAKRKGLAGLSNDDLKAIFEEFRSVNPDLPKLLILRFKTTPKAIQVIQEVPCVFSQKPED